jgi:hypothetical protein
MTERLKSTRVFLFLITVAALCIILQGCEKTNIQFGEQYVDNNYSNILLVDSITPALSTVFKDSVPSSQTGTALAGGYSDPSFGKIAARSFLQLVPATNALPDLLPNAQYDSLVLLMKCNGSACGDTTSATTYLINEVSGDIALPEGQYSFYNTSSFPVYTTPLGSRTVTIRPLAGDSANIPLPDSKGTVLFDMLRRKSDTLKTNSIFTSYFKGINISAAGNSNVINGFRDSVVMRLYYHETGLYRNNKYFDFTLGSKSLQFNNISYDRSSTPVAVLNSNNREAGSAQTGNAGYSQPATGLYMKIGFPTIRNLLQRTDYVKMVKAELIVRPVVKSFGNGFPLPPQLVAATTDALNEPGAPLMLASAAGTVTQLGNLFIDNLYSANTNYTYDVTTYLQQQISLTGYNQNGLLLIPPADSRHNSLNRLVAGDTKNPDAGSRIQLRLYYISITR